MNKTDNSVKVRDLGLAAALISSGFTLSSTCKDEKGRTHFVFLETVELDIALDDYWSGTLKVTARRYFDDLKMLKSRIYSES